MTLNADTLDLILIGGGLCVIGVACLLKALDDFIASRRRVDRRLRDFLHRRSTRI